VIHETIVTTLGADDTPHHAPMGICRHGEQVQLAPFHPSATLTNLRARPQAVVNLCDDVRVFAGCLTGRGQWPTVPATAVHGWRLRDTAAHLEVEVERIEEDAERPRFHCRQVHAANHTPFRGFNRAQGAVLEAAILVSRLHLLPREHIDNELARLQSAVDKTAGEHEQMAWGWLQEHIRQARGATP